MTVAVQPQPVFWKSLEVIANFFARSKPDTPISESSTKETRARREFILEMMESNPEAFQSELDFQSMMHFYPSRL